METFLQEYWPVIYSSAAVYIFIIVAIRLFGKKEFAQLSVVDLVFVLLISNAVQNAMVGPNTTLSGGIVAASTLFVVNYLFKYILFKFPKLHGLIAGEPKVLIYKGRVHEGNMAKSRISINELIETVREHGCDSIQDVNLAILETDGNISVLSNDFNQRSVHERKKAGKRLGKDLT
jgi:uncharacterized membrane protein YcaP (DUF421 family)